MAAKDKHGRSGGWSATGLMRNDGQSHAAHLQVNFLESDNNPAPSKNYTVQFSVGTGKVIKLPFHFTIVPGGTTVTITGPTNTATFFDLGGTVDITLPDGRTLLSRQIVIPGPNQVGNVCTFTLSSPIDAVTSSGTIIQTSGNNASLAAPVNPVAEIKWSVEGNSVRRLVSVTNGMTLTGVGEGIKVSVSDQSFQVVGVTLIEYPVDITVAPGSRASVNQPPTLAAAGDVGGGFVTTIGALSFKDIAIPQDAGVISVYITVIPAAAVGIPLPAPIPPFGAIAEMLDQFLVFQRGFDALDAGWVPIVPTASFLRLVNNTSVLQFYTVTFGIDG